MEFKDTPEEAAFRQAVRTFIKDNAGLHLSATNLTASLGGGLVTIGPSAPGQQGASGAFDISAAGAVTGSFSGFLSAGSAASGSTSR